LLRDVVVKSLLRKAVIKALRAGIVAEAGLVTGKTRKATLFSSSV